MGMGPCNNYKYPENIHQPYRENRYLLFLTENFAALEILNQYLCNQVGDSSNLTEEATMKSDMEAFVLFGSSFPRDKEYTQVILFLLTLVY